MALPKIPEMITVHLGRPEDSSARNVTVPFPYYIKNVASSEIYPTWPENAIRANIYAQVSFALNRIYSEWYRSQGYDFDITNSTAFDQAYVDGREIFDNVGNLVDELFDDYLTRPGSVEPLFAQYCNGTTVTCDGLSQWGTVPLAEAGKTPYQILTAFYGNDLNIVRNAPIAPNIGSYPGTPLQLGDFSDAVRTIQLRINRISNNYPAIPKIYPVNASYDQSTAQAVKAFQKIFNLNPDGIVGKNTWYRIAYLYAAITKLAELSSEGLRLEDVTEIFPPYLRLGDKGNSVSTIQYYLSVIATFYPGLLSVTVDGDFGKRTEDAVKAFQKQYNLPVDGIVGAKTWERMNTVYDDIQSSLPDWASRRSTPFFPRRLVEGMSGDDVRQVQEWLNILSEGYPEIKKLPVTGYFGSLTEAAVLTAQTLFGITPSGIVGPITWETLAQQSQRLQSNSEVSQ